VGSANPGQNGNIVVFAHARNELFGPLRDIKKDETIYILTKDRWYRYSVSGTKLVDPSQIENIKPTDSEQLTLFTCSGFLDSKRLIVHAKPLNP
jgi:sortase A